jgi:predicted aldo/keto reductase-like oxidoreductase
MKNKKEMNRRHFLRASAISLAGAGVLSTATPVFSADDKKTPVKIKEYRTLGRTGFKASDIGAGKPDNPAIVKALINAGVNYIDTGESYGNGQSERAIGEGIQGVDRKSVFINSKLSMRGNPSKDQILTRAHKCLERLKTDYLDCMMMHSCGTVELVGYQPFHDAMKQLKSENKLRFVGLSNHGGNYNEVPESMEKVLLAAAKDGRFDLMLLVYNFLKRDMGEKILEACKEKNIGTTIMKVNPVGSYLAYKARLDKAEQEGKASDRFRAMVERMKKRADKCQDFIQKYKLTDNDAIRTAAYRFVLNHPDVHSSLFNFSNFEQIDSVVGISGSRLNVKDKKTLAALEKGCSDLYCRHACGICESKCPAGVPVNTIMRYNHYFDAKNQEKYAMRKYADLANSKADKCFNCSGGCEKACPYGVPIQGLMVMAHHNLTLS